nr:52 kDa repressor of the inhibitor of the protein kinase-like [Lytechinus pictus]
MGEERLAGLTLMAIHYQATLQLSSSKIVQGFRNFLALLEHKAARDPVLDEHLRRGKKNQKYISKTIQNDIILTAAECLKEELLHPLKKTTFYSIIADEVTDPHANQEVLSVCVRFLDLSTADHPQIKEVFIDFIHLRRATGEKVGKAIMSVLRRNGLDVKNIRGQAYDGASAMSSSNVGTQAQIKAQNPLALYTHCRSHVLNLAVAGSCKVQALRNVIGIINELYLFFQLSPKRQRYLEFVLQVYAPEQKVKKLKGLCKARWVERHDCLETLVLLYKYIVTCLHSMVTPGLYPLLTTAPEESGEDENYEDWNWDRETLVKAEGLRCSLTSGTHISALVVLKNGLQSVKALSVKLQKRDSDIFKAYGHIDFVTKEIQSMRVNIDEVWDEWFIESCAIAEDVGSSMKTPRTTNVQRNRANVPADTPSTYFKRAIAVPFLDSFSQGLTERFSPENRCMRSIMGLLPSVLLTNAEALDEQMQELMFWEADLPSPGNLKAEIQSWTRFFQNMDKAQLPENLVDCLGHADEDFFPNIRTLIILGCTSPVTSCEAERSFGTQKSKDISSIYYGGREACWTHPHGYPLPGNPAAKFQQNSSGICTETSKASLLPVHHI